MILLSDVTISAVAAQKLIGYQNQIDALSSYEDRVNEAKIKFSLRNRKNNSTFAEVKKSLHLMCHGSRRCMYCEDSCADEVEHIRPKDLYPDLVFVWENYLYSCGVCNVGKSNQWSIIDMAGTVQNITRKYGMPIIPPENGDPALINPRLENPLDFLGLDINGNTFAFGPLPSLSSREQMRAQHTIDVLSLNRSVLNKARKSAFISFRARLREYVEDKILQKPQSHLQLLIESLENYQHPTVWKEMKRQQLKIPELKALFDKAPEALNW